MKIYVSHLRRGDYITELYEPLLASKLAGKHTFIFPHVDNQKPFNTKELFSKKGCDIVLAEISYPATGQGIELGWADMFDIPIYSFFKKGQDVSRSALSLSKHTIEYESREELIKQLIVILSS